MKRIPYTIVMKSGVAIQLLTSTESPCLIAKYREAFDMEGGGPTLLTIDSEVLIGEEIETVVLRTSEIAAIRKGNPK
jgi:hypothetical protein